MTLSHSTITADEATPTKWILMLHGIYGSGRNWAGIARRVVAERPEWGALLVDLRLHGGSVGFAGPHTLAAAAEDVERLVESLDFHAAAVLGHSFGGKVALRYAQHHGEELRQAWVIDSTLAVREPGGSAWRLIGIVRSLPDHFASRDAFADALAEHGYSRPLGQWLAMNLERGPDGFRWRLDWDGVEDLLRDYFAADLWSVIESPPSGVEVHVARATESDALTPADLARIRAAPNATLHELRGGHWINADNPDAVVEMLVGELV